MSFLRSSVLRISSASSAGNSFSPIFAFLAYCLGLNLTQILFFLSTCVGFLRASVSPACTRNFGSLKAAVPSRVYEENELVVAEASPYAEFTLPSPLPAHQFDEPVVHKRCLPTNWRELSAEKIDDIYAGNYEMKHTFY